MIRNSALRLSRRVFAGCFVAGTAAWPQSARHRLENLTEEHEVNNPYGLRTGPDGNLYTCEIGNHRISKLDLETHKLTTVLDGQKEPYDLRFDESGLLFFVDMPANQVRSLDLRSGMLTTVAGTGMAGFSGDGGPGVAAELNQPHSIAFDRSGALLICDIGNHRIRRVDRHSGVISTFAGTGQKGDTPEGASREGTPLNGPRAIDFDQDGTLYLALREGNRVYRLDAKTDQFHHVAGTGEKGYSGDGGNARLAKLSGPKAIACGTDGSVYLADTESHTIRRISPQGVISTIAGTGERGDGPTGDPLKCKLSRPHGLFVGQDGTVYIGDSEANRLRKIV